MPLEEMSLASQVRALESKCQNALDVVGEVLATLRLNQKHFLRDDKVAAEVFDDCLARWEKRLGLAPGWEKDHGDEKRAQPADAAPG